MASFLPGLLAVTALLLAAARTGHAAPSTAEVLWRAVLSRLRTDTTSGLSKGTSGMAKAGAGRSTSGLDYDDYTRLPPAAVGKEAPFGYEYKTRSDGSAGVREDDGPFGYDYKAPNEANKAASESKAAGKQTVGAPFNYGYDYKAPSKDIKARRDDDVPFNYSYKESNSREVGAGGGEAASESESEDGGEDAALGTPYNYSYKGPSERRADSGATASEEEVPSKRRAEGGGGGRRGEEKPAATTVFFHEDAVRVGSRLHFRFPAPTPAPLGLLPRRAASSVPFSTRALPHILALFRVPPGSSQAAAMAETLRTCEWPPLAGESKFCTSSLEALVESAAATLGTRDVKPVTSTLPRAGAPLRQYTVRAVRRVEGESFVACHDEPYPYTVYRCHTTGPARAYVMEMEGGHGDAVIAVATVCHTDTSLWNPDHLSFKLLGTRPGGAPICHLMPYGHIIWAKNVKSSPA